MKSIAKVAWPVAVLLTFCVLFAVQPAYAYVDPGSGSLLIQMLIAAVVGISFTIRLYWGKLKELVRRWMGRKQ